MKAERKTKEEIIKELKDLREKVKSFEKSDTERKQLLETIHLSEKKFKNIIEHSNELLYIHDTHHKLTFVSPQSKEMLGYTPEEMMMEWTNLTTENPINQLGIEITEMTLKTGIKQQPYLLELYKKDRSKILLEIDESPFKDDKGNVVGIVGAARNVTEQKRMEKALHLEKQKFETLSEKSPYGIVMIDKDGTFQYLNPKFIELFGYDLNDVPDGKTWFRKAFPDQTYRQQVISTWINDLTVHQPGEIRARTFTVTCKDGMEKIINFLPVQIVSGQQFMTCEDISDRKKMMEALQQSEHLYRTLIENSLTGIYMIQKDNYVFVNDMFCKITGYSWEELKAKHPLDLVVPENKNQMHIFLEKRFAGEEVPSEYETQMLRKDGNRIDVQVRAALIFFEDKPTILGNIIDITERKRTDVALKTSEEKYRSLVESSSDAILMLDKGRNIISYNHAFCDLFGYEQGKIEGKSIKIIHSSEESYSSFGRLAYPNINNLGFFRTEWDFIRKDGTLFPAETVTSIIGSPEGGTIGYVATIRDIRDRKKTEQEKSNLQEQLRQSQKIEAIGRLAGGVAHDFNNLLTVILGTSELLLLELEKGSPLIESIEEIKRAAERAATLTHQLLAFSRRQVMEFQVLDLNAVLRNLEKMLRRIIGEDIELLTLFAEDLDKIKADPNQIEQILMNLAVNAKDAMPQGGRLIIETDNVELDEEYARAHIGVKPGRYVRLSLSDTGIGMPPELKERVFEPFFTTKEKGKGTGLGLSTVYGIVKQSNGNIWLYSEPMKGTTIKIYLPRVFEPLEEKREGVEIGDLPFGNETILVVEDEEEVRKLAVQILKKQGYQVLEAQDGDEALALCENYKEPIHLVLTDVVMPGMGGRELVNHLRDLRLESKVVYMSGYTNNAIVHHGILEKGINYVQKPFTIEGLLRKIWEVLHR